LIRPPCALSIGKSGKLTKTLEFYPSGRLCIEIPGRHDVIYPAGGKYGERGVLNIRMREITGKRGGLKRNTRVAETTLVGPRKVMKIQPDTLRGAAAGRRFRQCP
jgi:hypothetical protein